MSIRTNSSIVNTLTASLLSQCDLIYQMAKTQQTSNFVISPIALRSLLAILSIASIKKSHKELLAMMGFQNSYHGIQEYKACRNASKDEFVFTVHNAFYVAAHLDLSMSFKTICLDNFQTRIENMDFHNREEAKNRVNNWIAEQTEGHIATRLTANALTDTEDSLLINIARFESKWKKSFPKKLLTKEDFWITPKENVKVTMMHDFCEIPIGQLNNLKATAMLVPYRNVSVSLFILFPNEIDGLARLEDELQRQRVDITSVAMTLKPKCIKLGLPKFKLECDIDMQPVLKDLGVKAIFSENMDFVRLLSSLGVMKISQLRQIAAVEINDDGTNESSTKVSFLLSEGENCSLLEINHPFFFAIMDEERIYYGGHITNTSNFLE
ncbi:serine protease inhibitor 42Dd-like [Anastrepha obliqua]|uniref:serine protease inhibitor 42Dd-like n=1 Tax=Anastrepha obliqua TaxID=95512 RepID=UPI00240A4982|nr:serine protease inhibitor 42Dd-like [Anastrepha obliqua]